MFDFSGRAVFKKAPTFLSSPSPAAVGRAGPARGGEGQEGAPRSGWRVRRQPQGPADAVPPGERGWAVRGGAPWASGAPTEWQGSPGPAGRSRLRA